MKDEDGIAGQVEYKDDGELIEANNKLHNSAYEVNSNPVMGEISYRKNEKTFHENKKLQKQGEDNLEKEEITAKHKEENHILNSNRCLNVVSASLIMKVREKKLHRDGNVKPTSKFLNLEKRFIQQETKGQVRACISIK